MTAHGFTEVGKLAVHRTSTLHDSQWLDVLACNECGSLIFGGSHWLADHDGWHKKQESARGGRGGDAYVFGSSSTAIGGGGGTSGIS
jgi:hypothetical protein